MNKQRTYFDCRLKVGKSRGHLDGTEYAAHVCVDLYCIFTYNEINDHVITLVKRSVQVNRLKDHSLLGMIK